MKFKRTLLIITTFILILNCFTPLPVYADDDRPQITGHDKEMAAAQEEEEPQKIVRVGWYESTYCYIDDFGRRRGIAYEYQRAIAAHTGWKYEYVTESWSNLMQMLLNGEIDLLSDVSYTEERDGKILYPDIPMGSEGYYMYTDIDNEEMSADDLETISGKRIGVNKGSIQEDYLKDWLNKRGINAQVIELTVDADEALNQLVDGRIDAYVGIDSTGAEKRCVPLVKVGASEYFVAVNAKRPDLLVDLNNALSSIQDEDPYFTQRLLDEWLDYTMTNAYLVGSQVKWLKQHGPIKLGYVDKYLPFCAYDMTTGDVTGALADFLKHADNVIQNAEIVFETVPYTSTQEALNALNNGDICCVFPANLSTYDCEEMGLSTTNSIMDTEMYAVMKKSENLGILKNSSITVAINEGNINYENFIMDNYPEWAIVYCANLDECLHAVASDKADYTLISDYRAAESAGKLNKYSLMTVPTGVKMGYKIAVREDEKICFSVLNKIVNLTGHDYMDASLSYFSFFNREESLASTLKDNWLIVLAVVSAAFIAVILVLLNQLKKERLACESSILERTSVGGGIQSDEKQPLSFS